MFYLDMYAKICCHGIVAPKIRYCIQVLDLDGAQEKYFSPDNFT